MLEFFDEFDGSKSGRSLICQKLDLQLSLLDSAAHSNRDQVAQLEEIVSRDPVSAFEFDDQGWARVRGAGLDWAAGRFSCPSLLQLRQQLETSLEKTSSPQLRLWVLEGTSPITDIGALQAIAPPDSLFQVASQYNCLESPGPYLAPVKDYFFDPTQGPRASISAYPGTLLRHYSAPRPGGGRFVQQHPEPQLNLLHNVALEGVAQVESGYMLASNVTSPETFANLLQDHFEDIEVGLQERTQVVFGANWDGPVQGERRISQVLTSTLAAGGYSRVDWNDPWFFLIARQLQRAAYLGTLRAAAATSQRRVILTLIGGGVFGNPLPLIWDSILWACQQVRPLLQRDLTVLVNGRNLLSGVDAQVIQKETRARGGDLVLCTAKGAQIRE